VGGQCRNVVVMFGCSLRCDRAYCDRAYLPHRRPVAKVESHVSGSCLLVYQSIIVSHILVLGQIGATSFASHSTLSSGGVI
jgi:hypothetical protein